MMDAARAAEASWPDRNFQFSRLWSPPDKRKRQGGQTPALPSETQPNNTCQYNRPTVCTQRAVSLALRRADQIDGQAALLAAIGQAEAALRLAVVAAGLRGVAVSATLPAASRSKLAKLLGMLGSDHPGERDAAALAAHRLVTGAGLTWPQIVSPPPADHPIPERGTWRQTVRECLEQPGSLRTWEAGFLRDLPKFRRLSVKQRYVLKEIADRVLKRGAA